jgi:hypothetical protein
LPCGSRSMTSTREPCSDRLAARLTAVVVFPTPPFWFAIVMIRQALGRGQAGLPARTASAARAARAMGVSDAGSATTGVVTMSLSSLARWRTPKSATSGELPGHPVAVPLGDAGNPPSGPVRPAASLRSAMSISPSCRPAFRSGPVSRETIAASPVTSPRTGAPGRAGPVKMARGPGRADVAGQPSPSGRAASPTSRGSPRSVDFPEPSAANVASRSNPSSRSIRSICSIRLTRSAGSACPGCPALSGTSPRDGSPPCSGWAGHPRPSAPAVTEISSRDQFRPCPSPVMPTAWRSGSRSAG